MPRALRGEDRAGGGHRSGWRVSVRPAEEGDDRVSTTYPWEHHVVVLIKSLWASVQIGRVRRKSPAERPKIWVPRSPVPRAEDQSVAPRSRGHEGESPLFRDLGASRQTARGRTQELGAQIFQKAPNASHLAVEFSRRSAPGATPVAHRPPPERGGFRRRRRRRWARHRARTACRCAAAAPSRWSRRRPDREPS